MIRLDATTRKLQIVLAGAITTSQLPVIACWSDNNGTTYTGGTTVSNSNSTTAVDIVAAPAGSTVRDIDSIAIFNADTVSATVTVRYNDNGTTYVIFKTTLSAGEQLLFTHATGWKKLDIYGFSGGTTGSTGAAGATGATGPTGPTSPLAILYAADFYGAP